MATIDSLDIQIKSSAGSAKQDIEALAKALEKLSGHESVKRIVAVLNKLPQPAAKSEKAIKRLSNANKEAANSSEKHSKALGKQSLSLLATYEHLSNVFSMIHGVQEAFNKVMNDAIQWDGIQFRFGRAFGEDAEEVLEYAEKVSETLRINQQQFMQYSSMYGSLLSGFGMAQKQVTTISVGLTELSYDIWAAYNDRYKSLEDASEAIRSAITGEIEPIRNAGIALTEASMQEYLDSIGMASTSVEKLTEAQKSELRYAVMVNSAMQQGIVGTYAREMNTAEGAVRTLTQQLKTLGQAFGSLFIPILQKVLPWVSAFVELLTEGLIALGAMFGIEFQEIKWGDASGMKQTAEGANATADALGDAAKNAKAMKSYALGFDELNVINPPSDSGGAGAAGAGGGGGGSLGLDLDTLWDNAVFESASKQIDELKEKIKAYIEEHKIMLTTVGSVTAFFTLVNAIRKVNEVLGITKTLGTVFTGILNAGKGLANFAKDTGAFFSLLKEGTGFIPTLAATFPNLTNAISGATKAVTGFVGGLTIGPILAIVGIITAIVSVVVFLKRNWEEVTAAVKEFFNTNIVPKLESIKESWERIKEVLVDALPESWINWFKVVAVLISALVAKIGEWFKSVDWIKAIGDIFEWVGDVIFTVVSTVIAGALSAGITLFEGFSQTVSGIVQVVTGVVRAIVALFSGDLTEAWDAVKLFGAGIIDVFEGMKTMTLGVIQGFVNGAVDWFTNFPTKALQPIKTFCDGVKQKFVELWDGVKAWFNINVAPKFTTYYWMTKFDGIKEGFKLAIKNAVNAGIGLMNKFIGWINEKMSFSWEAVEIAGKQIVAAGSIQLFTIPEIPKLEKGGFLEDGLFTMNRGEIAGKFNNGKSVVANNQQIVEGIAAGVYEAVVAAMNATSGNQSQSVNVYLDGKQITAAVEKRQNERGRTLMGNQLGYVY